MNRDHGMTRKSLPSCLSHDGLIGKLVQITSQEKSTPSWLENEHKKFVRFITIVALCISTVTFCVGLAIKGDQHLINTFINGFLIVVVASVPQGLPVTLTSQLIIVARRLTKIGMFLKRVDVADTLGLTSVLLTDKSGILTSNQMKVVDLWFEEELFGVSDLNSSKDTDSKKLMNNQCFKRVLEVISVCDRAQIRSPKRRKIKQDQECMTPKWSTNSKPVCVPLHHTTSLRQKSMVGKATDVALVKFVEQIIPVHDLREGFDIVYELPFSAQRRFQLVIAREKKIYDSDNESDTSSDSGNQMARFVLMVKGAPEELIRNCSTVRTKKDTETLDGEKILEFEDIYSRLASGGKSCIAFAELEFQDFWDANFIDRHSGTPLYPENGWCFLGMAAIFDKPLPEVRVAVNRAKEAGIKLFMVTGDHPTTAEAVAKQIGFFDDVDVAKGSSASTSGCSSASDCSSSIAGRNVEIIHGDTLNDLTEVEWKKLLSERHVIFARTTPSQKLMIIEQCHRLGEVVTMTGDGLMDARALKKADTGIAIDGAGSVFAKEAADVVTTTADLSKIMNAISEGRLLFDNLRKTIAYTLSHLQPELLPVLFSFVLGLPLGLTSVQVLTVDLLTELPPSIALIFEPAERDNMKRPPRKKSSHLVTGPMLWYSYVIAGNLIGLGCVLAYFTVFWHHGFSISDALFTSDHQWLPGSPNITASHTGQVFDGSMQVTVHQEACAAWQITLVMSQVLHLWQCSTRRISIFRHGIRNWILVLAVLFEVGFLMCLIFMPWLQRLVEVRPPPMIIWVYPFGVGICLLVFNEAKKYIIRQNKNKKLIKLVKW
ncbi:unnamed protein product [Bursaphelenchus xylophilus]|uniref:(pine wood nematode) hypothetical protein n=1 Tax=Bursaphelenchus xylophilus TaxID=6326 RepID=A0A1I7SWY0_BURXY|nr:unnamed protein product [Bursaphelenchus xylophilus]CAG9100042.1 unnamed protein product [Bursaphelenchus xylophilus]